MKDYVPLVQSLLWVCLTIGLVFFFREEIGLVRKIVAKRLEQGASFELGPFKLGELRDELKSVRRGLDEANQKIRNLFLAAISPPMYENLKKLASDNFGPFQMSNALERELSHLRDVGFISVQSIKAIPATGANLSNHVSITDTGREFVALREKSQGEV